MAYMLPYSVNVRTSSYFDITSLCSYFDSFSESANKESKEVVGAKFSMLHASNIKGLSWTHAGDGILLSGESGEIAMFEIPETLEEATTPAR